MDLVGGAFKEISYILPFANAVDAGRAAISGDYGSIIKPILIVCIYAAVIFILAIFAFKRKMNSDRV